MLELTDWERSKLQHYAASNAVTYITHFSNGGRWTLVELAEANRWRELSFKLGSSGEREEPWTEEDFPEAEFIRANP